MIKTFQTANPPTIWNQVSLFEGNEMAENVFDCQKLLHAVIIPVNENNNSFSFQHLFFHHAHGDKICLFLRFDLFWAFYLHEIYGILHPHVKYVFEICTKLSRFFKGTPVVLIESFCDNIPISRFAPKLAVPCWGQDGK